MAVDYGRRFAISVIDERARTNHPTPYASIPKTNDLSDGFEDISYPRFANGINRCARWIQAQENLASASKPFVYVGPSDLRYQILVFAGIKTGHVMFFTSPRNSLEAHLSLLDQAGTNTFIIAEDYEPHFLSQIMKERAIHVIKMPTQKEIIDPQPVEHVNFDKSFDEVRMEPFMILHTSGSTGLPKTIWLRHAWVASIDAHMTVKDNFLIQQIEKRRLVMMFPGFHAAFFIFALGLVIFADSTLVMPPSHTPVTADVVQGLFEHGHVKTAALPPSIIVDMASHESYLTTLGKLDTVAYGGGPLPTAFGDKVSKYVKLFTVIGATEWAVPPMKWVDREDWQYFNYDTEIAGMDFRDIGDGELFEMVLVRKPEIEVFQAIFTTFPELNEYHTKDLYRKHPSKPGLWKHQGRFDDVIVFTNGEKVNPINMEHVITTCPLVNGCVVVGQMRFQTAVLIEPKVCPKSEEETKTLGETVWTYVQKANKDAPSHGRIDEDLIIFTSENKPLPRAPKGTIIRQRANDVFREEIEAAYQAYGTGIARNVLSLTLDNTESAVESLRNFMQAEFGIALGSNDDFFSAGMDSLQVMNLTRHINQALGTGSRHSLETRDVYRHPSVHDLILFLQDMDMAKSGGPEDEEKATWEAMEKSFQDAVRALPRTQNSVY